MKKILLLVVLFISFLACKKDDPVPTPTEVLKQKMTGMWTYVSMTSQYYDSFGVAESPDETIYTDATIEFKSTGVQYVTINGTTNDNDWVVVDGATFNIATKLNKVITLNDKDFIYSEEVVNADNSKTVYKRTLSR